MSRLSTRGTNKSSLYTATEASDFITRASFPHTLKWKLDCYNMTAASMTLLQADLPVIAGTLEMDSSDPIRRKLQVEVASEIPMPTTPDSVGAPFGQALVLYCAIDKADGTFFPWLKMGEFQVRAFTYELPSKVTTIKAEDWSAAVDEYQHLGKKSYGRRSLAEAVLEMCQAALPNKVFSLDRDASTKARTTRVSTFMAEAGSSRWERATFLADIKGCEALFDWNGDLVVRDSLSDDDDEVIPAVGPDIGTVSNPVAIIADGEGGNLVGLTATVTRDGACNFVRVNINSTVTRRAKKQNKKRKGIEKEEVDITVPVDAEQKSGPAAWGDAFGHVPIVLEKNVKKITAEIKQGQQGRANRTLHRRRGVTRFIDLDAVGLYWVEPDDKVKIKFDGHTEDHFVQSIRFDLTGEDPTRIRTRQLATVDPG